MQLITTVWTFLVICFITGNALTIIDSTIATSCIYYEKQFKWGCTKSGLSYSCYCKNINWLQTITNCVYNATSSTHLRKHAFEHIIKRCKSSGNVSLTMEQLYKYQENGTHYLVDYTPLAKEYIVNGTLRMNETDFDWYHKKFKEYTVFVERSQWFGWGLVLYWVFIISIASIFNINKRLLGFKFLHRYKNMINKTLLIPSMFKDYHDRPFILWKIFPFDFPTRNNALVITGFTILTIISVCVGYNVTLPHPNFTARLYANIKLIGFRTDLMAISLFPVIYFFGIRNNPFAYISGISYSKFNLYHKCCAYACTILAFMHTVVYTIWAVKSDTYSARAKRPYWRWGIVATTLLFLLVFHSNKMIRNYMYETFLLCHKIMSVMFIVAMYYHMKSYGWMGWVWSMVAIYSFDRFMRLVRIVLHGGIVTATLKDCGDGIIKMTVKKPKYLSYKAGSYAFVYFLSSKYAFFYNFQSHPFTVLTDPTKDPNNPSTLMFYFKAHKGITRNILSRILSSGDESIKCKILLEGPYGAQLPQRVKPQSNMIAIAAGLGSSAVYPHIYEVLKNIDVNENEKSEYQHKFIWIIREINYLNWFHKELEWLKSKNCGVKIIVTGDSSRLLNIDTESSSKSVGEHSSNLTENLDVEKLGYRPNLQELVIKEISKSEPISKDITFVGCGPAAFNDELRSSVAKSIPKDSSINIEFQSESFVW